MHIRRIFIAFVLFPGLMAITGCKVLQEMARPEVSFKGVKLRSLNFEGATLVAQLGVKNPLPVDVPVAKTEYQMVVEGQPFIKGVEERQTIVGSGKESTINIPLRFAWRTLYRTVKSLAEKDSFSYTLQGKMHLRIGQKQSVAVPFKKSGKLPVVKMPKVGLHDARILRATMDGVEVATDLSVFNPNSFPLILTGVKGEALIGDIRGVRLHSGEEIHIPPREKRVMPIRMRADIRELGLAALQMFTGKNTPPFILNGKIVGRLPIQELSNPEVVIPLKLEGHFDK